MNLPLDAQAVVTAASLWLGLALLMATLVFVRLRRRSLMLAIGIALVGLALLSMLGMLTFTPDVAVLGVRDPQPTQVVRASADGPAAGLIRVAAGAGRPVAL